MGLVNSLDDFYIAARTILVKSERYFDLYDQAFAHHFRGVEFRKAMSSSLSDMVRALLEEWLKDPKALADALGIEKKN